jgi:hypothetical protein
MSAAPWGRPLGMGERFAWLSDRAEPFHFHVWAELEGAVDAGALAVALERAQRRHPLLRAAIEPRAGATAAFVAAHGPVPLRVAHVPADARHRERERDLRAAVPAGPGPAARCTLLRHGGDGSTLLLTLHHAFGDGRGAAVVLGELLRGLAPGSGAGGPPLPEPFPPPAEALLPRHARGVRGLAACAAGLAAAEAGRLAHGRPSFPGGTGGGGEGPRLVDRRVPGAGALVRRARREGVTVHAALLAALARAAADDRGSGGARLLTGSPVDVRTPAGPAAGTLFLAVGMAVVPVDVRPGAGFWDTAREAGGRLSAAVAAGRHLTDTAGAVRLALALAARAGGPGAAARRLSGLLWPAYRRSPVLGASNLGALDGVLSGGPCRVAAAGAAGTLCASDLATFAATAGGVLAWTFVARGTAYAPGEAERFADRAVALLVRAFAPPPGRAFTGRAAPAARIAPTIEARWPS